MTHFTSVTSGDQMADVIEAEGLGEAIRPDPGPGGRGFSARRGTVLANACGAGVETAPCGSRR